MFSPKEIALFIPICFLATVYGENLFVANNNPNAQVPYNAWSNAASDIQTAIDYAAAADIVWVSNGVYDTGGMSGYPAGSMLTNRIAIYKTITVQSINGPQATIIKGNGTWDSTAVRCAYLTNNALLAGFTLMNGGSRYTAASQDRAGAGAFCDGNYAKLSNCIIASNSAIETAGGVFGGSLLNCQLLGNISQQSPPGGGAAVGCTMSNCVLIGNIGYEGGGANGCTLHNCLIMSNSASNGGGAAFSALYNCLITGNHAINGGGVVFSTIVNCTLVTNMATQSGGGIANGQAVNCIIQFNSAPEGYNYHTNYYGGSLTHCCTLPNVSGEGNFTMNPEFADASNNDFRLLLGSPCIDAGTNCAWMLGSVDIADDPRLINGTVDVGAYEFQYNAGYWAWAACITNGLTNYLQNSTSDGFPNLLKYASGSSPTTHDDLARIDWHMTTDAFITQFHRNTNALDVTIIAEVSSSITNGAVWKGVATNRNGLWNTGANISEVGTSNPVSVQLQDHSLSFTCRYIRLRVTRP